MVFGMLDGVFFKLGPIPVDHIIFTEWVIIGLIGLIAFFATRDMQMVPRGLQNAFEAIIVFTYDFFTQLMDKEHVAKKWAPLLTTFFLFIILSNYSGLLPGAAGLAGFQPPTSNWNITLTLASVSYTHLDVYKRQLNQSSIANLTGSFPDQGWGRKAGVYFKMRMALEQGN